MEYPKPKRAEDIEYLQYIREQRCCACGREPVNPHHLITVGAGGSDYTAVPLDIKCHTELGSIGQEIFQSKHHINLWKVCARLLAEYKIIYISSSPKERPPR